MNMLAFFLIIILFFYIIYKIYKYNNKVKSDYLFLTKKEFKRKYGKVNY